MLYCFEANLMSFTLNFVTDKTESCNYTEFCSIFSDLIKSDFMQFAFNTFSIYSEFYFLLFQMGSFTGFVTTFKFRSIVSCLLHVPVDLQNLRTCPNWFVIHLRIYWVFFFGIFLSQRKWHFSMIWLRRLQSNLNQSHGKNALVFNHKFLKLFMYRKLVLRVFCFFFFIFSI